MYEIDNLGNVQAGNKRAFGHTVQIDVSAWNVDADMWKVAYQRAGETQPYYVPNGNVTIENGILTWLISEAVTALDGVGSVVIEAWKGGEMLKPSDKAMLTIGPGLEASGEAPTPVTEWINDASLTLDQLKSVRFNLNSDGELEVIYSA